jgi:hypothetical protein
MFLSLHKYNNNDNNQHDFINQSESQVEETALLLHIRVAMGSNLGWNTGYSV